MPIYEELKQDGVSISYIADAGKIWDDAAKKERRVKKRFGTREEAEEFLANHSEEPELTGLLYENRIEFLNCYRELKQVNATIGEATHYFIKHGAKRANIPITDLITSLIELKRTTGAKDRYITNLKYNLGKFSNYVGGKTLIGDINSDSIRHYIHVKNRHCSRVTKNNLHVNLSILFNYAVDRNHISFSPLKEIDKLKGGFKKPSIMQPEQFQNLLNYCLENNWVDRVAVFVLIGFCGVRREEASKLKWSHINLNDGLVEIPDDIAKNWSYRTTPISKNASVWLNKIKDKRWTEKPIIGQNWESLLKSAIRNSKTKNSKNSLRHSYASYSLAIDKKAEVIAYRMGHGTDTRMIAAHYRNLNINKKVAIEWWSIIPKGSEPIDLHGTISISDKIKLGAKPNLKEVILANNVAESYYKLTQSIGGV